MSSFPIDLVRAQFPALENPAAYLDNPAGTQVPRTVSAAVGAAMNDAASNLGGYFQASQAADSIYEQAHEAMAVLLGGSSGREIVIGQSMTMLTFQMSRSLGRAWGPGDELIVTQMDHEGNVSPWLRLAEDRGMTVRWLPFNRDSWRIEPDELAPLLSARTRLLALNYASNLTGSINPVAELARLARQAGALVYVDAVQFVPHGKAEVARLDCDFLACSAYKFFGPHLGVLWGREALLAETYAYAVRCAPQLPPGRHETGTPQTELHAGLAAAAGYFAWLGGQTGATGSAAERIAGAYAAATHYEMGLAQQLIEGLLQIPGVKVQGITGAGLRDRRVPTVSIIHPGQRNSTLARALAAQGINVWSGHNYALELARRLGLEESEGVLRIGLAHYNTQGEVERILAALRALLCS
ncbi:MAG: cysteine desulfurase-like protein [Gammaproteobacteria bacterium]|nr:cysteine desulfurase-like protein [Gammaproteobacteria bacterium]MDE2250847.1 cysteine desulfurase-like protein [Gammaproteobacteria bacterium]